MLQSECLTYFTQFAELHVCLQFPKTYVRLETERKREIHLIYGVYSDNFLLLFYFKTVK